MWALSKMITGFIGFFHDVRLSTNTTANSTAARVYSQILTDIDQTISIGSSDLYSHFINNHVISGNVGSLGLSGQGYFSDQRIQDINVARNRTLNVLIEELSSNITLSLISNPLLA